MEDCLFCSFVAGNPKPDVVFEDDEILAFRDINPQAPTHVLLIPKRHVRDASALTAGDGPTLEALFAAAHRVAEQEGVAESGYRLVANVGPDAGQSVFHLHVHLVGGRRFGWPPG